MSDGGVRYGSEQVGDEGGGPAESPEDDFSDFLGLLHELKVDGCNILVVGDARRELFTRASTSLLGDASAHRYRVLAVTDASSRSVADRLPAPETTPQPLSATTKLVSHVAPPRSLSADADADVRSALADIPEARVADPGLAGLRDELVDGMAEFERRADGGLRPAELRVGLDSLSALLDHYDHEVVCDCVDRITERARAYDAMAHYVLPEPYGGDRVQSLVDGFDAVIELRSVDPAGRGHDAEERWHVPDRDLTMDWLPL